MEYIVFIKLLGTIVLLAMIYKGGSYIVSYSFFKKLDKFIQKDLTEENIKYITNELTKYKLGRNSYNWDVLSRTIAKVEKLDISKEVKDNLYKLADDKGMNVQAVIDELVGE